MKRTQCSDGQRAINRAHAKILAVDEQANATPKTWRLLRKLRRPVAGFLRGSGIKALSDAHGPLAH